MKLSAGDDAGGYAKRDHNARQKIVRMPGAFGSEILPRSVFIRKMFRFGR